MRAFGWFALTLVIMGSANAEELLEKDNASLLGKRSGSKEFKTCRGNRIDLDSIKPYKIESTDRTCPRDIINSVEQEKQRQEELEMIKAWLKHNTLKF